MPTNPAIKHQRIADLRPIFALLDARGMKRKWLADQLEIARPRLSKYEHGERGYPDWFIEQASEAIFQAVGVRPQFSTTSDQREDNHHEQERDSHPASQQSQQSHQRGTASSPSTRRKSQARSSRGNAHNAHDDPPERADPRVASGPR